MGCPKCGENECCCTRVISRQGEKGKTGDQGPPGPGPGIVDGNFTLNAAGTVATGGVLSNPGSTPTLLITINKAAKLVHFDCYNSGFSVHTNVGSYGKDDKNKQDCVYFNDRPLVAADHSNSIIVVNNAGNGWNGKITALNPTTFRVSFSKVGEGLDIVGQFHAITG